MTTEHLFGKYLPPTPSWDPKHHVRREDPETSHAAARRVAAKVPRQCGLILDKLRQGPCGTGELRRWALANEILGVSQRISDLRKLGYAIEIDEHGFFVLREDETR